MRRDSVMSSRSIMRQSSHASSSNSNSSPKGRLNFFKKWPSASGPGSRDEGTADTGKIYEPSQSDGKIVNPTISFPTLELTTSSSNGMPSPDSFVGATHDTEFLHLKENIRRLRKAPSGPDPKKVDTAWEYYMKLRDESLQLCKNLLQKSQKNGRNASLDSNIGPLDTRSSFSGSVTETYLPFQVNEQWLGAINEYKGIQETMLETLRTSLVATHNAYEPEATSRQLELFLTDRILRKKLIKKWRDTALHRMRSEKPLFWEQYSIRMSNFDKLKLDLQATEKLFDVADSGEAPNMSIREYVIATTGDAILEFANTISEIHPILRFRVSSHLLAEASPLFKHIFSPQQPGHNPPLDMVNELPPPPSRHICKDGMEVRVFRMPQFELNNHEALTILLHAAHMHNPKVPRQIDFPVFVAVSEVCLRYRCTSPLELQVEYQWLPQWIHMLGDENFDGFLLISYTFGLRTIFTRMSKSAILNALDEEEIQSKELWPQIIRDKIKATRAAKFAQIRECCTNAIEEYFRPPSEVTVRRASVGSLQFTTLPRCPKGSHLCDATNLGWLMLVYNELRVLPNVMNSSDFPDLPKSPVRSLKELVDCLRLMPSAPQVHSGVCDYAPAFRSAINDIYNSVSGLTLRDVSGRNGWALSKNAGPPDERFDATHEIIELEAPLENMKTMHQSAMSNEDISLRILTHIDSLDDLNAAAMIDRTFYGAYKRNEASLLKNVMKAERRRTLSFQSGSDVLGLRKTASSRSNVMAPSRLNGLVEPKVLLSGDSRSPLETTLPLTSASDSGGEDLYDTSPPQSPMSYDDITHEEAQKILWPDDDTYVEHQKLRTNGQMVERNEKCLVGDVAHIEDKARMVEDDKHLREEKDHALGLGIHKK